MNIQICKKCCGVKFAMFIFCRDDIICWLTDEDVFVCCQFSILEKRQLLKAQKYKGGYTYNLEDMEAVFKDMDVCKKCKFYVEQTVL